MIFFSRNCNMKDCPLIKRSEVLKKRKCSVIQTNFNQFAKNITLNCLKTFIFSFLDEKKNGAKTCIIRSAKLWSLDL